MYREGLLLYSSFLPTLEGDLYLLCHDRRTERERARKNRERGSVAKNVKEREKKEIERERREGRKQKRESQSRLEKRKRERERRRDRKKATREGESFLTGSSFFFLLFVLSCFSFSQLSLPFVSER